MHLPTCHDVCCVWRHLPWQLREAARQVGGVLAHLAVAQATGGSRGSTHGISAAAPWVWDMRAHITWVLGLRLSGSGEAGCCWKGCQ